MLRKIFTKNRKTANIPDGKRIYAIGDIHGRADLLATLLDRIAEDADDTAAAQLIFLGDYVDRGPESKAVLDLLIEVQQARPDAVFLKGNHEAIMLDFLNDPSEMLHWLEWGGEETLESYGLANILGRRGRDLAAELHEKLPPAHLPFLQSLGLKHIEGDYIFVHAGIRPGIALDDQQEEDLLWIRKRFHNAASHEQPAHVVVHGHQPMKQPLDAGWRIGVDTGACWTGKLTAVVLENDTRRFLTT